MSIFIDFIQSWFKRPPFPPAPALPRRPVRKKKSPFVFFSLKKNKNKEKWKGVERLVPPFLPPLRRF